MSTRSPATYHEHLIHVDASPHGANYLITCSCGWSTRLAAISDLLAAKEALAHVQDAQTDLAALFARL